MYKLGKLDPRYQEIHRKSHERRITYKGMRIQLKFNPRTGKCKWCGREGKTEIHHIEYHDDDPLKDTIELCKSCHGKETYRLGQIKHDGKKYSSK